MLVASKQSSSSSLRLVTKAIERFRSYKSAVAVGSFLRGSMDGMQLKDTASASR